MTVEHWAAYYRGGALVSCPTNPEPGYTGQVRAAWEAFFGALPAGAAVLDLGTGNGPVALIAKEVSDANGLDLRITGVDLADIDPPRDVADGEKLFEGIHFRGGVRTEALPFDAGSFHAVSGQFIVEYTDTAATLAEIARVLAAGGRLQLAVHHADSLIVANARESLRQADMLREERLLEKAGRFFERSVEPGANVEPARRRMIESGKRLEAAAEGSGNPLLLDYALGSLTALLEHRARLSRGDVLQQLKRLGRELDMWEHRLNDLVGAAMNEPAVKKLEAEATDAGLSSVRYKPQHQDGDVLIGWCFEATKPVT